GAGSGAEHVRLRLALTQGETLPTPAVYKLVLIYRDSLRSEMRVGSPPLLFAPPRFSETTVRTLALAAIACLVAFVLLSLAPRVPTLSRYSPAFVVSLATALPPLVPSLAKAIDVPLLAILFGSLAAILAGTGMVSPRMLRMLARMVPFSWV